MSVKLLQDLTAAHLNAIVSSIHSLELQIAALKTVVKELPKTAAPVADAEEDEAPAKKTKAPAPAPTVKAKAKVEEDFGDDEDTETETEEQDEEEQDEEEAPAPKAKPKTTGLSKAAVITALQAYSAEHGRNKAMKVLGKFGVKSVHDLSQKQYSDILTVLG